MISGGGNTFNLSKVHKNLSVKDMFHRRDSARVPDEDRDSNTSSSSSTWEICGKNVPRSEVMYICQMILICIVIVSSIINLSINNGRPEMWVSFFGYAFGAALPPPKIKSLIAKGVNSKPNSHNVNGAATI